MTGALLFVALAFTAYRVFRFLGLDDITAPLRRPLHLGNGRIRGWLRSGAECPWCLGTWVSFAIVYLVHRFVVSLQPNWLLWAAAVSCVVGFLGEIDDRLSG